MARRKASSERMIPVLIYLTPDQLDWIDNVSSHSRGDVVRHCVNVVQRREKISINALERQTDPELSIGVEFATDLDCEIVLDAYSDLFLGPLKEAAATDRNIDRLVPTFRGLIKKMLRKSTSEQQVRRFLYKKMDDVSVTE